MRIAVLLLLLVAVAAVSAQRFGRRGRQRGRITVRTQPSSSRGRAFRPSTRVSSSSSSFRPSSSRSSSRGRQASSSISSSISSFSSPSSSSSFSSSPSSSSSFSAPSSSSSFSAPAPAPGPEPLSFTPPIPSGPLSFAPPGPLTVVRSSGGAAGGFGPIRPANPSSACGPNCFGPGLDNVFAEPVDRLTQHCVTMLANRIPGARVMVDIEGEISIVDQLGIQREGVFDSFGRNLLEGCDI